MNSAIQHEWQDSEHWARIGWLLLRATPLTVIRVGNFENRFAHMEDSRECPSNYRYMKDAIIRQEDGKDKPKCHRPNYATQLDPAVFQATPWPQKIQGPSAAKKRWQMSNRIKLGPLPAQAPVKPPITISSHSNHPNLPPHQFRSVRMNSHPQNNCTLPVHMSPPSSMDQPGPQTQLYNLQYGMGNWMVAMPGSSMMRMAWRTSKPY